MAYLKPGDIRKFKNNGSEVTGVVVSVDTKWKCYDVITSFGVSIIVDMGKVVGPADISQKKCVVLKEMASKVRKRQEVNDLRMLYTREMNKLDSELNDLRNQLVSGE